MQRYYVLSGFTYQKWTVIEQRLPEELERRNRSHQLLHWRESVDGLQRLIEAEVSDEEHAFLESRSYIEYIGGRDEDGVPEPSVYQYLRDHHDEWHKPLLIPLTFGGR